MKRTLLATTFLTLAGPVLAQITPGSGPLTDASGNGWSISPSGSIQENGKWTPGGGGTSALIVEGSKVFGEDANGRGWFAMSGGGQYWTMAAAPPSAGTEIAQAAVIPTASVTSASEAAGKCPGDSSGGTGAFHVASGQIIGLDGKPFIARGINILEGSQPSLAEVQFTFPGVNFIRFAIYDYPSAGSLASYVRQFTAVGIVVELEDHSSSDGQNRGGSTGQVFSGQRLTQELSWYGSVASAFADDPRVWFGTDNEPPEIPSAAALSTWQLQTYQAIRSTGNVSPVMVEMNCDTTACGAGYTPSAYAGMTNIIWDMHFYNWLTGYSTDQTTIAVTIATNVARTQTITSADGTVPVIMGEYGNSTTGADPDPGAEQIVAAVIDAGSKGEYGSAAWAWGSGGPGDGLTDGNGAASAPYGQQVELYTNISIVLPSACQIQQQAAQTIAAVVDLPGAAASDPAALGADAVSRADAIVAHATGVLQGNIGRAPAR
jgi:hypothetical protein